MKLIKLLLLILLSVSNNSHSQVLINQGNVTLKFKDIDEYAYTIPASSRHEFFQSSERIEKVLLNLLTINHLLNYIKNNNIEIDKSELNNEVILLASNTSKEIFGNNYQLLHAKEYSLLKNFYEKKLIISKFRKNLFNEIDENKLLEIIDEDYSVNHLKYISPAKYNIDVLAINYNKNNYIKKQKIAENLLILLKDKIKFSDIENNIKYYQVDFIKNIEKYQYDKEMKQLADIITSKNETGIINEIIDIKNERLVIIKINRISPSYQQSFDDIKPMLIEKYKKLKFDSDYEILVMSLTKDKIITNQEYIFSLKERYKSVN